VKPGPQLSGKNNRSEIQNCGKRDICERNRESSEARKSKLLVPGGRDRTTKVGKLRGKYFQRLILEEKRPDQKEVTKQEGGETKKIRRATFMSLRKNMSATNKSSTQSKGQYYPRGKGWGDT